MGLGLLSFFELNEALGKESNVAVALFTAALIGAGIFTLSSRLLTEVGSSGLCVQFKPLHRRARLIPLTDATRIEAINFSPLRDYGGWGIRGGKKRRAYIMRGRAGVRITFADGRTLLIGSQRANELAAVLSPLLGK